MLIILQLLAYWQTRRSSVELDALCAILLPVIRESHGEIESLLERISTKYGDSLASPSKRNPNCVVKMLQWHLLERDIAGNSSKKHRLDLACSKPSFPVGVRTFFFWNIIRLIRLN